MSEIVSAASGQPRFTTLVMSFFASIAFFLAALGLYGILAYSVEQRVREIGVRVALGADKREIFRLIIGNGMRLALVGAAVGVPSALALTRLMSGMLSGVIEHRSSDVHRCRWDAGDLGLAGELLAGSPRHTCGPDHRATRGVAIFFA